MFTDDDRKDRCGRACELLKDLARSETASGGDVKSASALVKPISPYAEALDETDMSYQQAHRFQQLAAVPEETFEQALAEPGKHSRWALLYLMKGLAVAKLSDGAKTQRVFWTFLPVCP